MKKRFYTWQEFDFSLFQNINEPKKCFKWKITPIFPTSVHYPLIISQNCIKICKKNYFNTIMFPSISRKNAFRWTRNTNFLPFNLHKLFGSVRKVNVLLFCVECVLNLFNSNFIFIFIIQKESLLVEKEKSFLWTVFDPSFMCKIWIRKVFSFSFVC